MSMAAPARRSRRGTRQYLPFVLGLAFLATAMGAEHRSGDFAELRAVGEPTPVVSTFIERTVGQPALAAVELARADNDLRGVAAPDPVWVAPEPVPAPVTTPDSPIAPRGSAASADGPRAPPPARA